ncbi:MAG TPA: glycosyltransferase family 2 protein [Bryobacteraceae bacterium]|nr:glycosyltransferase family 2 protein [Bryobacteraceae bacterium]
MNCASVGEIPGVSAGWHFRAGSYVRLEPARSGPPLTGVSVIVCTAGRPQSCRRLFESIARQGRVPNDLIIVDSSAEAETEEIVRSFAGRPFASLAYARVKSELAGLTKQRNFGLQLVPTELVAFFDDDTVLEKRCIAEMEAVHESGGDGIVGVGAYIANAHIEPPFLWRLRRALRITRHLRPGTYDRSGWSIPWSFLPPTTEIVEGDWLPGGAAMWKTDTVRRVGFCEAFQGYGWGEDLEFSLRARRWGRLVVAGRARLDHLTEGQGRPDQFRLGYMETRNRWHIHERCLEDRSPRDRRALLYGTALDTLLLACGGLLAPWRAKMSAQRVAGRIKAAYHLALRENS